MSLTNNSEIRPSLNLLSVLHRSDVGILSFLARRIHRGSLRLELPNGAVHNFIGGQPGPSAAIAVHRPRAARRLLFGGSTGFAEAYIDGDWSSDDLPALLELAAQNEPSWRPALRGSAVLGTLARIGHWRRKNTRSGSRRNIASHYDLGNDFYRAWLDPGMTYSAGFFTRRSFDLEQAQTEKFDRLIELLHLSPRHHLLEIGAGWGAFALHAAQHVGCQVTAITISKAQHAECCRKLALSDLGDRVEFRLQDYRDLDGRFDRVVSVEMIEAVGEAYWPLYFSRIRDLLPSHGRAVLQAITIDDELFTTYRRRVDFIQRHIFPGGMLPSRERLVEVARRHGLAWHFDSSHGEDYAKTLACWSQRFDAAWPRIRVLGFDERFRRAWRYYLAYCEAGFRTGRTDVRHIVLAPNLEVTKGPEL